MRSAGTHRLAPLAAGLLLACGVEPPTDADVFAANPRFDSPDAADWSAPVHLGVVVNSTMRDENPMLTADGLSLYFASDRPGGLGATDIWVTRRASHDSPWEEPRNLGPPINTALIDGAPSLSPDGHVLFIHSNRTGTQGGNDIWVARRSGSKDEEEWETPVNLGSDINTAGDEQGPEYVESEGGGALYFNRGNQALNQTDIYRAGVKRDGRTDGPAEPVTELNDPLFNDQAPTLRADAREILFWSTRLNGFGGTDMYISTRQSPNHLWSPPENAGPLLNTAVNDLHPELSQDGLTLFFSTNREGSLAGSTDLWMSTRAASAKR